MRILLLIGPDAAATERLTRVLDAKRAQLEAKGVLFARSPGRRNHTRLFMAVSEPGTVDMLRFNRGFITAEKQAALRADVQASLAAEVAGSAAHTLVLACHQLGTSLPLPSEIRRLQALLDPVGADVTVIAHVDEPGRMLARRYAQQVLDGRATTLDAELALTGASDWWDAALAARPAACPEAGVFPEVQGPAHWLDTRRLVAEWEAVFGRGRVALHALPPAILDAAEVTEHLRGLLGLDETLGRAEPADPGTPPSAAWLSRARRFNAAVIRLLERTDTLLARPLWRKLVGEIKVPGAPIDPGSLSRVSGRFRSDLSGLRAAHPGLDAAALAPDPAAPDWQEADPERGFRATQYLMAFRWRIRQAAREEQARKAADLARAAAASETDATAQAGPDETGLTAAAQALMPPLAKQKFAQLRSSPFAPHNRLGAVDEEALAAAFTPVPPRPLPEGTSGNVVLGCMKNEGPYIVEWIAYHRAIGVDRFLIYTNGCEDGTDAILGRLQELGVVEHRDNDDWTGNSPQQHALNAALAEPVVQAADWLIHIDVDEFINVRCGNGTLADFLARVPEATNVAMTWRLFGHGDVTRLADRFVIDQFEACAPAFCPKPHTAWGYKTMFRNIGAYQKISCHRPNKLAQGAEDRVRWVNGSGQDITGEAIRNGWRSSKSSVGYDLLQLNHYALRSAESFLIKRQRGRALHVDRSIGLNYWIRMDWSGARDITIKRNLPRLRAEYDRLMADPILAGHHAAALDWHRAKLEELHATPEFAELYAQALAVRLTETERAAYALALDLES